jgi:hypothetical protein
MNAGIIRITVESFGKSNAVVTVTMLSNAMQHTCTRAAGEEQGVVAVEVHCGEQLGRVEQVLRVLLAARNTTSIRAYT